MQKNEDKIEDLEIELVKIFNEISELKSKSLINIILIPILISILGIVISDLFSLGSLLTNFICLCPTLSISIYSFLTMIFDYKEKIKQLDEVIDQIFVTKLELEISKSTILSNKENKLDAEKIFEQEKEFLLSLYNCGELENQLYSRGYEKTLISDIKEMVKIYSIGVEKIDNNLVGNDIEPFIKKLKK